MHANLYTLAGNMASEKNDKRWEVLTLAARCQAAVAAGRATDLDDWYYKGMSLEEERLLDLARKSLEH